MASSEMSLTLSISQLLQFHVFAGPASVQPSLQLKPSPQPFFATLSPDLSSIAIKIQTQCVSGHRVLSIFAIPRPDQPNFVNSSSLAPSSASNPPVQYMTPRNIAPLSDFPLAEASPSTWIFNLSATHIMTRLAADFDFFAQEALMTSYDSFFSTLPPLEVPSSDYLSLLGHKSQAYTPISSASAEVDTTVPRKRPRRFACPDPSCKRKFASKDTLELHMTMRQHTRKVRYQCEMGCSETFSRQHDRLRHEVARHARVPDWMCHRCKHVFSSQSNQNKHKCPDFIAADSLCS
ncbi:hypothetical protein CONPUDRAFT_70647 [Coniophora puteana RWD-64-598 SS2]|uniref:C2H2-type domain-containing protein n=1 Tax=Coniophora puteana (strain RWD-64-598) TaxID=741705 RepID=A0A5M3MX60_CONPW|nr:uncharacterized protein CONPUDRAFT_70647 [Coniophora puteana RWD-64-598 SS2]EIW83678.1 hypothetical protein CONPUDRAFT_70647 [Coniophora puteana RWD-64-598 SS2]